MAKCGKCMRPGPITGNGYLNFLREFRKKNCNLTPIEVVRKGACAWKKLSCAEKRKYAQMGCGKKPSRSRSKKSKGVCECKKRSKSRSKSRSRKRCGSKRRGRSRSRKSSKGCGCKKRSKSRRRGKGKCMKPGPLTSNGYLNFLRGFRRKACGLKPQEVIRQGARKWCALTQSQKDRYNRMACKVTQSKRHKSSKICRALRNRRRKC